jgi:hypothetical protein
MSAGPVLFLGLPESATSFRAEQQTRAAYSVLLSDLETERKGGSNRPHAYDLKYVRVWKFGCDLEVEL